MAEDPLERIEREERERKENKGPRTVMIILAVVAVALGGVLGYMLYQRNSLVKDLETEKAELAQQGRSITWLATQLGYSRQYMYKLFRRKWIYTDLLLKISDLLDYDFFRCYSEWREQRDIITTKSSSWKE